MAALIIEPSFVLKEVAAMIKLCIFDMDGTVLNTINTIAHFANNALNKFGFESIETERYKTLVGNGAYTLVKRMMEVAHGTDEDFEKVYEYYNTTYDNDFMYLTGAYEGILEMLDELKAHGIKTAILSNKPDSTAKKVSDEIFGAERIDLCYGAREGKALKPDPESVFEIIDLFGVKKEECLYIGDTATDIQTAKNAELYSIGVLWGFRDEKELKNAGADMIVSKPCEIVKRAKA